MAVGQKDEILPISSSMESPPVNWLCKWTHRNIKMDADRSTPCPTGETVSDAALPTYVLITPARDEIRNIERTILSVVAQTHRPLKWVIVSDGSTDGTDQLVRKYCERHEWIELLRTPERKERTFAGKVNAFALGYACVKELPFVLVGSLDADISFDAYFYYSLISKFRENPRLGIGGTRFYENDASYDFRFSSDDHVSGWCQLFRRACFEDIGGYTAVKGGGIDVIAVLSARMRGWQTKTFTEIVATHHRTMGTAGGGGSVLKARFKDGKKDYFLGAHPIWEIARIAYQMSKRPFIIGGSLLFLGYFSSAIMRLERPIPKEMVQFRRNDQLRRLRAFINKIL
jgi:GT2 family glycosyltransferase